MFLLVTLVIVEPKAAVENILNTFIFQFNSEVPYVIADESLSKNQILPAFCVPLSTLKLSPALGIEDNLVNTQLAVELPSVLT